MNNIHHHHRRGRVIVAATVAATAGSTAALVAIGASTSTGAAQTASGAPAETTISFDQRDGRDHFVDVPPLGGPEQPPSIGDEYVATNLLLDPATGDRVGRTHSVCVTTRVVRRPLNAFANCTVVLRTGSGQIVVEGSWSFTAAAQRLAVTGGTGDYAGANGIAVWTSGAGERSQWEITLQP